MSRLLVIMGSGETAPTMVKPHRAIFERVGAGRAIAIDTPYGFQENADDISSRAVGYFSASVGRAISVTSWRSSDITGVARERALADLRAATWIFAGPGSPTYALRQWRDTPIPQLLLDRLSRDGVVMVFASAAALTLSSHTIPVYEIYKAGEPPQWVPGLNLVRAVTGLPAVIIPHYDNAEGGHHDTRFCYLGERRLSMMERALPPEAFILGVDEHTAVVFDLDARTASVLGNGTMTIRRDGHNIVHPSGDVVAFDDLLIEESVSAGTTVPDVPEALPAHVEASLRLDAAHARETFDSALAARDVDGCVNAILELEQAMVDWAADTDESDERDQARAAIRDMIVRLGDLALDGDPGREGALLDLIVGERAKARARGDYAASDQIRGVLADLGVEVRDTPNGATWQRSD